MTRRRLARPRWEAVPMRCYGCEAIDHEQDAVPHGQRGIRVVLLPLPPDDDEAG